MTYHLCTIEKDGWTRQEWIAYRSALVGEWFRVGRDRWEIVSVNYPGVSREVALDMKGCGK